MEWPSAQELGVGGTLALAALALTFRTVYQWKRNGNGKQHTKAGELDPADWEQRIEAIVRRVVQKEIDDKFENVAIKRDERMRDIIEDVIRNMFSSRTDELRRLFREELQHFYGLKGGRGR